MEGRLLVRGSARTADKCSPARWMARRLWDVATGKPLGEPVTHEGSVVAARFSPDEQRWEDPTLISNRTSRQERRWRTRSAGSMNMATACIVRGRAGARARDCGDLVQATLLAAVRSREKFGGRSSERSWLVGIGGSNKVVRIGGTFGPRFREAQGFRCLGCATSAEVRVERCPTASALNDRPGGRAVGSLTLSPPVADTGHLCPLKCVAMGWGPAR